MSIKKTSWPCQLEFECLNRTPNHSFASIQSHSHIELPEFMSSTHDREITGSRVKFSDQLRDRTPKQQPDTLPKWVRLRRSPSVTLYVCVTRPRCVDRLGRHDANCLIYECKAGYGDPAGWGPRRIEGGAQWRKFHGVICLEALRSSAER